MSTMERCVAALGALPESKLRYALAYIQGLMADVVDDQEDIPNAETIAALREGDEMLRTGKGQHFQGTAKEFFAMLDAEGDDDA